MAPLEARTFEERTLSERTLSERARDERKLIRRREATGMGLGCLFVIASTLLTCLLLFINGGLVQAAYAMLAPSGPALMRNPRFTQFVFFIGPVLLVAIQWLMIDFVIGRLRRST